MFYSIYNILSLYGQKNIVEVNGNQNCSVINILQNDEYMKAEFSFLSGLSLTLLCNFKTLTVTFLFFSFENMEQFILQTEFNVLHPEYSFKVQIFQK